MTIADGPVICFYKMIQDILEASMRQLNRSKRQDRSQRSRLTLVKQTYQKACQTDSLSPTEQQSTAQLRRVLHDLIGQTLQTQKEQKPSPDMHLRHLVQRIEQRDIQQLQFKRVSAELKFHMDRCQQLEGELAKLRTEHQQCPVLRKEQLRRARRTFEREVQSYQMQVALELQELHLKQQLQTDRQIAELQGQIGRLA